jgi:hypothetical protein
MLLVDASPDSSLIWYSFFPFASDAILGRFTTLLLAIFTPMKSSVDNTVTGLDVTLRYAYAVV